MQSRVKETVPSGVQGGVPEFLLGKLCAQMPMWFSRRLVSLRAALCDGWPEKVRQTRGCWLPAKAFHGTVRALCQSMRPLYPSCCHHGLMSLQVNMRGDSRTLLAGAFWTLSVTDVMQFRQGATLPHEG